MKNKRNLQHNTVKTMDKLPENTPEYISNLENEKDYVIEFELYNLYAMINNINNNNPYAKSPVYQQIIIPHLQQLIKKLELLEDKVIRELDIDGYKTIDEIINE